MQVLKEVYLSKSTNIILDCSKDIIGEVLTQAQQIGMISEDHFYLLTSLDTHTVDMSGFKVKLQKVLILTKDKMLDKNISFFSMVVQISQPSE